MKTQVQLLCPGSDYGYYLQNDKIRSKKSISLFYPDIPKSAANEVKKVLSSKFIAQGEKVKQFERMFSDMFCDGAECIAVNSGTSALHLAYILAGIKAGDEVITPVFTCVATNTPLLQIGAKIVFADIDPDTMNISVDDVKKKITKNTKAIICVHYGGLPCELEKLAYIANHYNIPLIEDAAHALGARYRGKDIGSISEYTCFSFQAIKHITTGDGGMLVVKDKEKADIARRLRWFGIDREKRQSGVWDTDIKEAGFKYQMNEIAAVIGIEGLRNFKHILAERKTLLWNYWELLRDIPGLKPVIGNYIDRYHAAWMCTVLVSNLPVLQKKLKDHGIESGKGHFRNDIYTVFGGRQKELVNMDAIEDKYLLLPLHTKMTVKDVIRICNVIKSGW